MDILDPFGEGRDPSPGEEYVKLADELASFVKYIGGPKLNEDALAVLIADFSAWIKRQ